MARSHQQRPTPPPPPPPPSFARQLVGVVVAALRDFFHWPQGGKALPETTPLHEAAKSGNIPELRRLLREGANPNAQDAHLNTPLHWAASPKATWVLLEAGASPNIANISNKTPLDLARGKQAQILYRHGAHHGLTPMAPGYVESRSLHD